MFHAPTKMEWDSSRFHYITHNGMQLKTLFLEFWNYLFNIFRSQLTMGYLTQEMKYWIVADYCMHNPKSHVGGLQQRTESTKYHYRTLSIIVILQNGK